jgi:hypothetical protein
MQSVICSTRECPNPKVLVATCPTSDGRPAGGAGFLGFVGWEDPIRLDEVNNLSISGQWVVFQSCR